MLSAQESVTLLTQAGLFDNAFTVAFHFNLPKETIFDGLASRWAINNFNIGRSAVNLDKHVTLVSSKIEPSYGHVIMVSGCLNLTGVN